MVRLHAVVEGQTEETFFRRTLVPFLGERSIVADAHRVTTGRRGPRMYRGGFVKYEHLQQDLVLWMKQDQHADAWFTTMIDLYRLPQDVPGFGESRAIRDPIKRVELLESRLKSEVDHRRFIPYIQLHEFEALLFSEPASFEIAFPDRSAEIASLVEIRRNAVSPEHIDDGAETAPSVRICRILPNYVKPLSGPIIAHEIGLPRIRQECAHFNAWVNALLGLA